MAGSLIAAFWGVSFVLAITPGADWAYAIAAGLRHRSPVPAVGGLLSGHLLATVVVAAGVAAVVAANPVVLTVLTVAGALYLAWLGVGTLRSPAVPVASDATPSSWVRQASKGLGISGLNPKVFLLFLAVLPQFTDPGGSWPLAVQIIVLGLAHVANCAVVYLAVGLGARRVLSTRPAAARVVTGLSGVFMICIGALLLVERLLP
jgi:threonine/homoserine/homoserine lactone efflux protein